MAFLLATPIMVSFVTPLVTWLAGPMTAVAGAYEFLMTGTMAMSTVGLLTTGLIATPGAIGATRHDKRSDDTIHPALFHWNASSIRGENISVLSGMIAESGEANKAMFRNDAHAFKAEGVMTEGKGHSSTRSMRQGRLSVPFGENATAEGHWIAVDISTDNETSAAFDNLQSMLASPMAMELLQLLSSVAGEDKST